MGHGRRKGALTVPKTVLAGGGTCTLDQTLAATRCCSSSEPASSVKHQAQGMKKVSCAGKLVWTYTPQTSDTGANCGDNKLSWAKAKARCESDGTRLCTSDEVRRGCVLGTGCNFEVQQVWTSGDALRGTPLEIKGSPVQLLVSAVNNVSASRTTAERGVLAPGQTSTYRSTSSTISIIPRDRFGLGC